MPQEDSLEEDSQEVPQEDSLAEPQEAKEDRAALEAKDPRSKRSTKIHGNVVK